MATATQTSTKGTAAEKKAAKDKAEAAVTKAPVARKSGPQLTDEQKAALEVIREAYGLTGKKHIGPTHESVKAGGMTPERTLSYLVTSPSIRSVFRMGHGVGSGNIVQIEKGGSPTLPSCRKVLAQREWSAEQAASALLLIVGRGGDPKLPMCKALQEVAEGRGIAKVEDKTPEKVPAAA